MNNLNPMSQRPESGLVIETKNRVGDYSVLKYLNKDHVCCFGTGRFTWDEVSIRSTGWRYLVPPKVKVEWESWEGTEFTRYRITDIIRLRTNKMNSTFYDAQIVISGAHIVIGKGYKSTQEAQAAAIAWHNEHIAGKQELI